MCPTLCSVSGVSLFAGVKSCVGACRKLAEARKLIMKGCELCPTSEDVWLEAARFQTPENAKALLARGVAANPTSIKLWMQVMQAPITTCLAAF